MYGLVVLVLLFPSCQYKQVFFQTETQSTRWMTPLHWIQQILADEVKVCVE